MHSHTVHLPPGALLIWCTMCGTGGLAPSLAALDAQVASHEWLSRLDWASIESGSCVPDFDFHRHAREVVGTLAPAAADGEANNGDGELHAANDGDARADAADAAAAFSAFG